MSAHSAPPLRLSLRPSRLVSKGLLALYALILPSLWLANLPWWGSLGLSLALLLAAYWHRRVQAQPVPELLRLLPDGGWMIVWPSRMEELAQLADGVYCSRYLIRLPLRLDDGRQLRLMLWPDSAEANELRRLRVWLRWGVRDERSAGQGGAS